ncbi:Subtilisin-like protein [Fusarium falciforme]|uniref:Subtilisin-like protein n=1 Tax=Fusarium falciforme TaxID=195108 RepID=UPI002301CC7B|nr:Subtilisin-like protein [Fusarium falciforme]WAO84616.1 Subtilisin-like protein [Fusarium falciforme]
MWDPHSSKPIPSPPIWPTLSLAELLKSGPSPLSPYDKVIMALNLGRMLLRTYGTGIDGCAWSAEDLFFLFESGQETAYQIYNPYLNYSLASEGSTVSPISPRKFPILIDFAKLLLEIACGKTLGPFKRRPDRPDISLLAEVEKDSVTEAVVAAYVHAIKKCLKANKDDDEDAESEEEQCRAVIRDAVADLEGAWSTAYATKRDLNHPKEVKVPQGALKRKAPDAQNGSVGENGSTKALQDQLSGNMGGQTVSSPNGLFDVIRVKMLGACADSRCAWATAFLERAEGFYNRHIHHLPSENRIRVAILDTGIDDTKVFFRAAKQNRTRRDSPVILRRSFLNGISVTDTDGHGTNVAALVLKMAPEADLYVAKISSGHEVDGTEHIADAIEWAIENEVHIINMSFGLSSPNWNIITAICRAESLGIICTAAASNYGSNQTRSFPAKLDQVLCIHAGDGNGNKCEQNPTPLRRSDNLSTLGVCIPSEWEDEEGHYISGTSYAAPVAAGIAANVLRFVRYATARGLMTQFQYDYAHSRSGMKRIMLAMCETQQRDGYEFVTPWRRIWREGSTESDVVSKMKEALE